MRILYVSSLRVPTERAYGQAIMRQCEAFADEGHAVELLVPTKQEHLREDAFAYYRVRHNFTLLRAWATDLLIHQSVGRLGYYLDLVSCLLSVYAGHVFRAVRADFVLTREMSFVPFALFGARVVLEVHALPQQRALYVRVMRLAHHVIVISEQLKNTLIAEGFPASRIIVLPSGVDLSVFRIEMPQAEARATLDLPAGPLYVYTGNFTTMNEDKGINDILLAMREVPEGTFVAVGAYQEDIDRYTAEAKEHGVLPRVTYRGRESQERLALYQRAADVLLMPFPDKPHYRNAMSPVKMFEYMCSDRPIIATDLPTIREVLDESLAYIVPPGDPETLARTMKAAISDTAGSATRAAAARKRVQQYTWRERAKRIIDAVG